MTFRLTERQQQAQAVFASDATHVMLFGGSRSGKTFLGIRNVVMRALKAPGSRHAIFRFRYNHLRASVMLDTWPTVLRLAFPGVKAEMHQQDGYAQLPNGSQIWFAGLDDKERTEKILGMEFATLLFNECSQIPYNSVQLALTRLSQRAVTEIEGREDGVNGGFSGSQSFSDPALRFHATAIVGGLVGPAAGTAMALKAQAV